MEIEEPFAQPPRLPQLGAHDAWKPETGPAPEDGLLEITGRSFDGTTIDLTGVEQLDIERCDLRQVTFVGIDQHTEVRVAQSSIAHTDLSRLSIRVARQSHFVDTKLVGTDFSDGLIQDCEFVSCVMRLTNFRMATLKRVALRECELGETDAYRAGLTHVSFEQSTVTELNLDGAEASCVDLRGAASLELIGINRLDGFLISEVQLPAIAHQLAAVVGLRIER